MKTYRASIYLDIQVEDNEGADEAGKIAEDIVSFLGEEQNGLPDNYYNPYVGGVALIVKGDLIGNMKRCENI